MFIFIGGIAADFLETRFRLPMTAILLAGLALRIVLTLIDLSRWLHQIPV
jgi:hypothetical protein